MVASPRPDGGDTILNDGERFEPPRTATCEDTPVLIIDLGHDGFESGQPDLAADLDDALAGFGEG
jgi:hypothetical protein